MLGKIGTAAKSVEAITLAIGAFIAIVSPGFALVRGGGDSALVEAVMNGEAAQEAVAEEREQAVPGILAAVCVDHQPCSNPYYKDATETKILRSMRIATRIAVDEVVELPPAEQEDIELPDLEERLRSGFIIDIAELGVDANIIRTALEESPSFGNDHEYARLVRDEIDAQITKSVLLRSPDLVKKPEWWRDWALGGGLLVGGLLIGGVVASLVVRALQAFSNRPKKASS